MTSDDQRPARSMPRHAAAAGHVQRPAWAWETITFAASTILTLSLSFVGKFAPSERPMQLGLLAHCVAAFAVALCAPPALYHRRLRTPLLVTVRASVVMAPLTASSILTSAAPPAASLLTRTLRSLLLLLVPLAFVDGAVVAAYGFPLPPAAHLVMHSLGVGFLMRRAPAACAQYVAADGSNALVVRALYWVLQQLTSTLCLGSRMALAVAADASTDEQQCTAVVWALQASLGYVLPTLMIWRTQLAWARAQAVERAERATAEQQRQGEPQRRQGGSADEDLPAEYRLLCVPALDAAEAYTWAVPLVGAALAGWLAAVFVQHA